MKLSHFIWMNLKNVRRLSWSWVSRVREGVVAERLHGLYWETPLTSPLQTKPPGPPGLWSPSPGPALVFNMEHPASPGQLSQINSWSPADTRPDQARPGQGSGGRTLVTVSSLTDWLANIDVNILTMVSYDLVIIWSDVLNGLRTLYIIPPTWDSKITLSFVPNCQISDIFSLFPGEYLCLCFMSGGGDQERGGGWRQSAIIINYFFLAIKSSLSKHLVNSARNSQARPVLVWAKMLIREEKMRREMLC